MSNKSGSWNNAENIRLKPLTLSTLGKIFSRQHTDYDEFSSNNTSTNEGHLCQNGI